MKILVVTKNWIGDVLFQLPAIEALRAAFPQAQITCMAPPRALEVLREHPAIDRLIPFDERTSHRGILKKLGLIFRLRRERFDRGYLFHRSKSRALLLALGGVRERIGFFRDRWFFLTRAYPEPQTRLHHADQMLELLQKDGLSVPPKGIYRFYYSPESRQNVCMFLERKKLEEGAFACFHLGANWEPKRWPPSHFALLADELHVRFGLAIVITGHSTDQALFQSVKALTKKARLISLVGGTTLQELAALFRRASFLVTGDSGPMHVAAGAGARVLALFGPTDPALTGPRGIGESEVLRYVPKGYQVPWYGVSPAEGWLEHIAPAEVLKTLERRGWLQGVVQTSEPLCTKEIILEGQGNVQSILFVTLSNIGDVILTTAVLAKLRGRFPHARITAVTGPRARGILEKSRQIQRLVIYDKAAGLRAKLSFVCELRRESYDLVIDLRNSAMPFLVHASWRSPLLRRFKTNSLRAKHLELLAMTGVSCGLEEPFDFFSPEDQASMEQKLKDSGISPHSRLVVVAPVAASELKTWSLEGYGQVVSGLLAHEDLTLVITGHTRERKMATPLVALNPFRVHNLAGQTTLSETAALLKKARLVVANDSSMMHLAHELEVPTVAIFGPTDHERSGYQDEFSRVVRTGSPCSPCEKPRCIYDRQHCLEDLKPSDVLRACEELLHEPAAAR